MLGSLEPSPAPGSWPAPRSVARPDATPSPRSRSAGTAPAGTCSPPRTPRFRDRQALSDVSCPLKRTCTAVGQSNGPTDPVPRPSSSAGSGASTPGACRPRRSPKAPTSAEFGGVSCPNGPGLLRRRRLSCQPAAGSQAISRPWPRAASARIGRSCPPRIRARPRERPLNGGLPRSAVRRAGLPRRRQWLWLGRWIADRRALRRSELAARDDPDQRAHEPVPGWRLLSKPALLHGRRRAVFGAVQIHRQHAGREVDALNRPS